MSDAATGTGGLGELTPHQMLLNTLWCRGTVIGPEELRHVLVRVLRRVPVRAWEKFLATSCFAMADAAGGGWLSPKLAERKYIVVLDRGILGRTDGEQAAVILPLVARAVRGCRHPLQLPRDYPEPFTEAGHLIGDTPAYRRRVREWEDDDTNQRIGAHFDAKAADELARKWQAQWEAAGCPVGPPEDSDQAAPA
jgi:hypothetical protein